MPSIRLCMGSANYLYRRRAKEAMLYLCLLTVCLLKLCFFIICI